MVAFLTGKGSCEWFSPESPGHRLGCGDVQRCGPVRRGCEDV